MVFSDDFFEKGILFLKKNNLYEQLSLNKLLSEKNHISFLDKINNKELLNFLGDRQIDITTYNRQLLFYIRNKKEEEMEMSISDDEFENHIYNSYKK